MSNLSMDIRGFYFAGQTFDTLRQKAKEDYWNNKEMTNSDYKTIVSNLPITFNSYQKGTRWSVARNPVDIPVISYLALGLGGESGEVIDEIKKLYRDDNGKLTESRKEKIKEELGDALYYLSALAYECDINLEEIARRNQEKSVIRFKEMVINNENNKI